jgi:uncharacterized protein YceK
MKMLTVVLALVLGGCASICTLDTCEYPVLGQGNQSFQGAGSDGASGAGASSGEGSGSATGGNGSTD